ncbi:MAG: folate-binding protein YgfZ [Planctomycetota bacterium]|jgi:folate-binding protein YgfZ
MKHSPLLPSHESAGARLAEHPASSPDSDPRLFVLTFGDVPAEYESAHSGCAMFDSTERGLIRVTGEDAASFLHGLLSNEVRSLEAGTGNANLLLSAKGKVLYGFDLFMGEDEILLSAEPGTGAALMTALDMYHFVEKVVFEDISEQHAPISVCGASALQLLTEVLGELPELSDHSHARIDWNGNSVWITALEVAGSPGYRIDAGGEHASELWNALQAAGASPTGQVVQDIMRVEAGRAAHGTDITDEIYPQEARLDAAFSLEKGCYIGQEVVAKIDTYGGLNKQIMVLKMTHDDPITPGTPLEFTEDGETRKLGVVTSWAYSFVLDTGLVLAYVKRKHQETGKIFQVAGADATIVEFPVKA